MGVHGGVGGVDVGDGGVETAACEVSGGTALPQTVQKRASGPSALPHSPQNRFMAFSVGVASYFAPQASISGSRVVFLTSLRLILGDSAVVPSKVASAPAWA
jgi:hypothetical protein